MSQELEEPWGQLITINNDREEEEERYPIIGNRFTIGRKPGCDIVLAHNKLVSSCHCTLVKDDEGHIWCKDTSTNGTLVEGTKIKNNRVKLSDSQIIKIVFQKDNTKNNVSFKFVDLRCTNEQLDMTQEYRENEEEEEGSTKRTLDERSTECVEEDEPPSKMCKIEEKEKEEREEEKGKREEEKGEEGEEVKEKKGVVKPDLTKKDSMEETLTCLICQEILHDCVSLQPCTHTYCGGCYSEWMEYSKECPTCRIKVERITKNFIVNNLVSAYLKANPEKRRPEEDLKELNEKNKIGKDMLIMSHDREEDSYYDDSYYSDSYYSDSNYGDSYDEYTEEDSYYSGEDSYNDDSYYGDGYYDDDYDDDNYDDDSYYDDSYYGDDYYDDSYYGDSYDEEDSYYSDYSGDSYYEDSDEW